MCADEICEYVNFKHLAIQFKHHNIELSSFIFHKQSTAANHHWCVKKLELELDTIEGGYQIFYDCLKETQEKCPAHGIVIERLEQEG